jgi:hypothetical protein
MVAYSHGRPVCRIVGAPELRAAVDAGHVRVQVRIALTKEGLGPTPIELAQDEEVVSRVQLAFEDAPHEAEAILIAKRSSLRPLRIAAEDPRVAELARMLANGTVDR